jgi:hypothetical protein
VAAQLRPFFARFVITGLVALALTLAGNLTPQAPAAAAEPAVLGPVVAPPVVPSTVSKQDPVDQLAKSGISVAVTGEVSQLADVPAGHPDLFLVLEDGQALALDQASLPEPV